MTEREIGFELAKTLFITPIDILQRVYHCTNQEIKKITTGNISYNEAKNIFERKGN